MDPKKVACKYADVDYDITKLVNLYVAYVLNGNTPLIEMPYEIYQVATTIESYKVRAENKRYEDKAQKEKQKELLRSVGVKV
ncbi:MAG: hypothetical protein ACR2MR_13545 [Dietzia maris]